MNSYHFHTHHYKMFRIAFTMKFSTSLVLLFFIIVSDVRASYTSKTSPAKFLTKSTTKTLEIVENVSINNSSQILLNLIANSMYDFNSNFRQWTDNKVSFSYNNRIVTNESVEVDGYSVSFGEINVQSGGTSADVSQLYCKFHDRLTVQLPFNGDHLQFSGVLYLTDEINYSIKGSYEILFKNLNFTLVTKLNTNQSEFQLNYMEPQIHISINSNIRRVAHKVIGQLVDMLKLHLKSYTAEKITAITRKNTQFAHLLTSCSHPQSPSSSKEPNPNYEIKQSSIQLNDQVTLNTKFLTIRGLENFNYMKIKFSNNQLQKLKPISYTGRSAKFNHTVSFRIDNLEGDLYWKLYDSEENPLSKYTSWEFTIDYIFITALFTNDRLNDMTVDIISLGTVTQSKDNFSLLGRTILEGKLSKIIASSLKSSFLQSFDEAYREVYF